MSICECEDDELALVDTTGDGRAAEIGSNCSTHNAGEVDAIRGEGLLVRFYAVGTEGLVFVVGRMGWLNRGLRMPWGARWGCGEHMEDDKTEGTDRRLERSHNRLLRVLSNDQADQESTSIVILLLGRTIFRIRVGK